MNAAKVARAAKCPWDVIIFDVDGVLVDVRESYQRTVLETVRHFTGKRVGRRELHEWKNRPGFNDDWTLTHAWVRDLGRHFSYADVKKQFESIYWGDGGGGKVASERWLLSHGQLQSLAKRAELAIFTGRTRSELDHTLDRFDARRYFTKIMTVENSSKPKPDPEGLLRILDLRPPSTALYLGEILMTDWRRKARALRLPACCLGEAWSGGFAPRGSANLARGRFWVRLAKLKSGWSGRNRRYVDSGSLMRRINAACA
ncbi:MAG: HAD hydrolase-like protein [Candidatus Acidiferrales bacterium]